MMMIDEYIKAWRSYQKAAKEDFLKFDNVKQPQELANWYAKYKFYIIDSCWDELNSFVEFVKENFGKDGE